MGSVRLRHLLVVGGSGFLGSAFARQRLREDQEIHLTILDRLSVEGVQRLEDVRANPRLRLVDGEAMDEALVAELAKAVDGIVDFDSSAEATQCLLDAARHFRHQRYLLASSDEVYGPVKEGRAGDDAPLLPATRQGAVHAAREVIAAAAVREWQAPVIIARAVETFGPFQSVDAVIPQLIVAIRDGREATVRGATREYLHVDDEAAAIARVLWKSEPGKTYNIGSGEENTLTALTDLIADIMGRPAMHRRSQLFAPPSPRYAVESKRIRPLGWEPLYSLREGLRITIEWYRKHPEWLTPAIGEARSA